MHACRHGSGIQTGYSRWLISALRYWDALNSCRGWAGMVHLCSLSSLGPLGCFFFFPLLESQHGHLSFLTAWWSQHSQTSYMVAGFSSGITRSFHISKRLGTHQLSSYSRGKEADFPECERSSMGLWGGKEWMVAIFEDCLLKFITRLN